MNGISFGNYIKLTLPHNSYASMVPGQCANVNGKWFAIAELRDTDFDIIVPHDSHLLSAIDISAQLPQGPGFSSIDSPDAVCLVAGTGLGAVISLVKYRYEKNLSTQIQIYGRNITKQLVAAAFPILNNVEFNVWNTTELGRPIIKSILPDDPEVSVFFAGPKGFLDEIKLVTRQEIILNF